MKSHELDPFLVVSEPVAPKHVERNGVWWDGLTISDLLTDPDPTKPEWLSVICSRLAVASTGPILTSGADGGALASRLEAAGWFRIAADADVNAARRAAWPTLEAATAAGIGAGSLAPKLVFVNDRDAQDRIPFFAVAGQWLFRAIRELGYDELSIYVVNANTVQHRSNAPGIAKLYDAFAPYEPIWIACGHGAEETLNHAGLKGYKKIDDALGFMSHRKDEGILGYARHMYEAGIEAGPWASLIDPSKPPLPTLYGESTLPRRVGLPSKLVIHSNKEKKLKSQNFDARVEAARTKFVIEGAESITAAGHAAGMSSKQEQAKVHRAARVEDWVGERKKHLDTIREKAKSSAADAEAKAVSKSRQLAWVGTVKALALFARSLDNPDAKVKAQDVKSIVDAAVNLRAIGDPTMDAEKARLAALRPDELAKELNATVSGMFGIETEEPKPPEEKKA